MRRFQNILFATQGLPGHSDALSQAMRLAAANRVPVAGLIASPELPDDLLQYKDSYEHSLYTSLMQSIGQVIDNELPHEELSPPPVTVKSSFQPAVTMIQEVMHNRYDLLIKEAEPVSDGVDGFKAIDMTLLRKCPCPVWLHRPVDKPRNKRRVAVAIDPTIKETEQYLLTMRLLELARSIADSCDSRLHVISCCEHYLEHYLAEQTWIQVEEEALASRIAQAQYDHKQALDRLILDSGIRGDIVVHHVHGKPDEQIPLSVEQHDIDVLVMGTIARTGIAGLVIGNTAENVFQSIHCSLVALKPQGFESPIK
ncbi:universal stress protein [Vibrio sp. SCSIO 43136]|uniref:universal stress protein n=1 Tax=Vibrio sp. SCSIO 43136 TaxID=2819101 RepID=UPI0020755D6D|nr:universal stress protein [Vibrio sp. SCSIO 43136]USD67262.1 universal stress protein [Vibrio sp. SCSIO 43136]